MAPIEHREGEHVEQSEVDVQYHAKPEYKPPTVLACKEVRIKADDHHRAAELLDADLVLAGKNRLQCRDNLSGAGSDLVHGCGMGEHYVRAALVGNNPER